MISTFWSITTCSPVKVTASSCILHSRSFSAYCSAPKMEASCSIETSVEYGRTTWCYGRSQWPRGLRHELSSLARKLGSRVRIPFEAFILCLCCSVYRLRPCDGLITLPRSRTISAKKITKLKKSPGPNKRL
jgi:hypothetical protein